MPLTANDLEKINRARTTFAYYIKNNKDLTNGSTIRRPELSGSDLIIKNMGAVFTTSAEQQDQLADPPLILEVVSGNSSASGSTTGFAQIDFTGIYDAGYGSPLVPIAGILDDAFIPIPMGGMEFNFFGTNYSNSISWHSNNALVFGTTFSPNVVSISATTGRSILIGNYDRLCAAIYYSNTITTGYSITTLIILFCDYFTDPGGIPTYKYQLRLIKENIGDKRQFVEVSVITSPPSPGYSSAEISYPTGTDGNGDPVDSSGYVIDQTKNSPYNITNGTAFINPCGTTFSTTSPSAGTSFVFSSDSTGSVWSFSNNSRVNL